MNKERYCYLCGVDFKYPSKLKRHLQTAKHKLYEADLDECEVSTCGGDLQDGLDRLNSSFSEMLDDQDQLLDTMNVCLAKVVACLCMLASYMGYFSNR